MGFFFLVIARHLCVIRETCQICVSFTDRPLPTSLTFDLPQSEGCPKRDRRTSSIQSSDPGIRCFVYIPTVWPRAKHRVVCTVHPDGAAIHREFIVAMSVHIMFKNMEEHIIASMNLVLLNPTKLASFQLIINSFSSTVL